ncbi:chemotaxis response regulator protein-glutamate methylesterase [Pseudoalteromonas sp. NBT06-2]|uniref:protein-glutamate methylesterase/protein-glutamine glutaminase n=1 Tax=Pseudoalteromonas sp. NBT06-2 TaxID=2025950 RepID=UPI000BA6ED8A|nr:chemotaxis response regulator protein-glutamate methylesterase [Pseudoalteromonas sp. NBT06-2]PAJ74652.1 chemotaxis response regulator protein-glutamate methylesterase [Pseudoalteromonas sp. NBT06-2]
MTIKVLVVDDSSFFRRRVSEILNQDPELEVIDTANNGKEAVEKAAKIKPDVITMDVEMPVLDGISAVKQIMKASPVPILMFSSLTHHGASATFDALDAGALDFLPKKFEDIARDKEEAIRLLQQKVKEIGKRRLNRFTRIPFSAEKPKLKPRSVKSAENNFNSRRKVSQDVKASGKKYKIVAIGTSTGGPVALQSILTQLPEHFPHPILLIQHMPAAFTPAFAIRLDSLCKIQVKEAQNGELLKPGTAYLAPGGKQMLVEGRGASQKIRIYEDEGARITYKPSVDITFASIAKSYNDSVLAIVLTGMGADGRDGARLLKQAGSKIWVQDEKTCVVYGMPQAVANAGLSDANIPLPDVANRITREVGCG